LLLGTPLTAREIVWGYWWGAFRPVLPLLLLPVAVSELSAHGSVRGIGTLLLVVLVLSCGAALASLGVGLAVWLNRAGRAITVVVVVYALVAAGWVAVVMNTFSPEPYGVPVIMASPWFGALALTGDEAQGWGGAAFSGGVLWSLVYLASAWGGFELTVARFDRKLRTSGRSVRGSKARLTPAAGRTSSGPPP
jgi:hypothetical protein